MPMVRVCPMTLFMAEETEADEMILGPTQSVPVAASTSGRLANCNKLLGGFASRQNSSKCESLA